MPSRPTYTLYTVASVLHCLGLRYCIRSMILTRRATDAAVLRAYEGERCIRECAASVWRPPPAELLQSTSPDTSATWSPRPCSLSFPHITVHRGSQCYRLAFWRCPTSRVARRPSVTCARCERCALPAFVAFDSWPWLQALRFSVGGRTVPCGRTVLWVTYGLLHDPITTPRLAFHVHMHMAAMRTCPGRTGTIRTATHVANQLHVRHATVGRAPLHGVP